MYVIDYTPEQRRAYRLVYRETQKGKLIRPADCELCGCGGRICAHHWNGYEHPFDIWWVCRRCNAFLDHHDGTQTKADARAFIAACNAAGAKS